MLTLKHIYGYLFRPSTPSSDPANSRPGSAASSRGAEGYQSRRNSTKTSNAQTYHLAGGFGSNRHIGDGEMFLFSPSVPPSPDASTRFCDVESFHKV